MKPYDIADLKSDIRWAALYAAAFWAVVWMV